MPFQFILRKLIEVTCLLDNRSDFATALNRPWRVYDLVAKVFSRPVPEATITDYVSVYLEKQHVALFRRQTTGEQAATQIVAFPRFR